MMDLKTRFFINQHLIRKNKKKKKAQIMFLVENQREHLILHLSHYILFSYITQNFLDVKLE